MRLPRIRFTVGTLLFAVVVVAANCWGCRQFYAIVMYTNTAGGSDYCIVPAGVGVLLLVNVALIGALLFTRRRLRSLRRERSANPRSSWSGFAYFSFHFLMLGSLLRLFTPGTIDRSEEVLGPVRDFAARGWATVFGDPGGTLPWIILNYLILNFFISGPPLLLSWFGQTLGTRCAASLPRRRFRAMSCLVSLGFAGAALAICLTPQPFEDEQEVALDFQVVDEVSGRPVAAAFVRMTDPFSHDPDAITPKTFTDAGGRARLTGRFLANGYRNAFQTFAVFSPWGRWLEVSAVGHPTVRIPLTDVLGPYADPTRRTLRTVALPRGVQPENPFRDLAGIYSAGGGFGGRWFEIEPDGRFAWCEWGCTSSSEEYGYIERRDGEIELAPIPHPGRDIHPLVASRYRTIPWGDRLYLATTDDHELQEFCREALTPNRPSKSEDLYGSLLRQSDRDKPQRGLPWLPAKVWVHFLTDEMSLSNEEGSLRLRGVKSVIPPILRASARSHRKTSIQWIGYALNPMPRGPQNPDHATLTGLDARQIDKLLDSAIPNPAKK